MKSHEKQYKELFKARGSVLTTVYRLEELTKNSKQWTLYDAARSVETNYKYMLRFINQSGLKLDNQDTEQHKILDNFKNELFQIYQSHVRENELANNPNIYYSKLRFARLRPNDTIKSLAEDYRAELNRLSQDLIAVTDPKYRAKAEQIFTDLFNLIFVTFPLSSEDIDTIKSLYSDDSVPEYAKEALVSALFLGLTYFLDFQRLDLLLTIYETCSVPVAAAAITAFNLIVSHNDVINDYDININNDIINEHLAKLQGSEAWGSDMTTVMAEFMRAAHTMTDSTNYFATFKSGLNNFSTDLLKRMQEQGVDPSDPEAIERFLSDAGVLDNNTFDQIKSTQDRLAQGDDIFLEPFARLKSGTFYNEPCNWFMPFHIDHSAIADIVMSTSNANTTTSVADIIESMTTMCDCDKYSLILSLTSIPPSMRETALSQLCLNQEDLAAMNKIKSNDADKFKFEVNRYMKNLTRFFKLSTFKNDIDNMLSVSDFKSKFVKGYTDVDWFKLLKMASDYDFTVIIQIALFNLNNKYIDGETCSDFDTCYVIGKCALDVEDDEMAITYLRKAYAMKPDDLPTIEFLAYAYHFTEQEKEAIKVYKQSHITETDNITLLSHYADLLYVTRDYSNALDVLFQIEYLDADNLKAQREIAKIYFTIGEFESAEIYIKRLRQNKDYTPSDDLIMSGYINLKKGKFEQAIADYTEYAKSFDLNNEESLSQFILDIEMLHPDRADFISHDTVLMITELIRFNLENNTPD
jgi:Flp pilus assembly protein TadD